MGGVGFYPTPLFPFIRVQHLPHIQALLILFFSKRLVMQMNKRYNDIVVILL